MEKRYRVTNADGSECYECRGRTFPSLEYALRVCAGLDDNAEALGGAPHRVQELVEEWRDVPVPEPLPDLPDTVYAWIDPMVGGPWAAFKFGGWDVPHSRQFKAPVGPWTEITEDPTREPGT